MSEDPAKLFDQRAADGSRHFAAIPDRLGSSRWQVLRERLAAHPGVTVTAFVSDEVTQAITDFAYRGYHFTVDTQFGEFWLFVSDPECPHEVLSDVARLIADISV